MEEYVVAVDLGATKIDVGLINGAARIVQRRTTPTHKEKGPQYAIDTIVGFVDAYRNLLNPNETISGLGICTPGPVDNKRGFLVYSPNLAWHNVPLREKLRAACGIPVVIEHDAKAAAIGEFVWGSGKKSQSMVYIVIGTGVGAAIILNGKLLRGATNSAGEVGHTTIQYDGAPGSSGIPGNVESFLSGPFLAQHYTQMAASVGTAITQPVTGKFVGERAIAGDDIALAVLNQAGNALGISIATLAMILDIELYIIGSSVATLGELLLAPARAAIPRYCFDSVAKRVRVKMCSIIKDASLLGCYQLVQDPSLQD